MSVHEAADLAGEYVSSALVIGVDTLTLLANADVTKWRGGGVSLGARQGETTTDTIGTARIEGISASFTPYFTRAPGRRLHFHLPRTVPDNRLTIGSIDIQVKCKYSSWTHACRCLFFFFLSLFITSYSAATFFFFRSALTFVYE